MAFFGAGMQLDEICCGSDKFDAQIKCLGCGTVVAMRMDFDDWDCAFHLVGEFKCQECGHDDFEVGDKVCISCGAER